PNAPKPDIRSRAVRRVGSPSGNAIPIAVRAVAKVRTALHHLPCSPRRPHRIDSRGGQVPRRIKPVGAPFPCVARNPEQSVSVRRERARPRCRGESVLTGIVLGKFALPDVAKMAAARRQLVAPRIELLFETPARR